MVRIHALLLVGTLAACALPPRETDRSTPEGAFRSFRGAIARKEYEREWDCLSDGLRRDLGMQSRLDWKDARAVVLTQDHQAIRGLSRAKIAGPAEPIDELRVRLPVAVHVLFFRLRGTLTLRREVVLRAWIADEPEPLIDYRLPGLRLTYASDGVGVTVPPTILQELEEAGYERGLELSRIRAEWMWFLDGFALGDEDPATIQEQVEKKRGK